MEIYIRDRMSFARELEGLAELIDSMISKADGIFLWVAFVTSRLQYLHESKVGWNRLKKEIDQAPEGLYSLFGHILQSLDISDLKHAYQTFAIIQKLGEFNLPLPLLSYPFINHYTGDSDVDSCELSCQERIPEPDRLKQARRVLMGYCGGLFEPTQAKDVNYFRSEMIISFTHRSLPDYLESLDNKETENHLGDFCVEDAASYLLLAFLWAKDTSAGRKALSYITFHVTTMRKDGKIGKVPFHFEEQLWSVLTRLGVKLITDQDLYEHIVIQPDVGLATTYMNVHNSAYASTDRAYFMSHPCYVSAFADNLGYVRWKLGHDPSVAQTPFHLILLFYRLLHLYNNDEPRILYQTLDTLRERGLSPQTLTTLSPQYYPPEGQQFLEVTIWQHLIMALLRWHGQYQFIWRWLLENGADSYFMISSPDEEMARKACWTVYFGPRERKTSSGQHLYSA